MKDYFIVFEPRDPTLYPNKRFLVSGRQLKNYITEKNANKVICEAETLQTNKTTIKFRKYGKIEIYLK